MRAVLRRGVAALPAVVTAAVALTVFLPPAPASAVTPTGPTGSITFDPVGTLAGDGTVTLTGTYTCAGIPDGQAALFSTSVAQTTGIETRSQSLDGGVATCDGQAHTWRSSGQPTTLDVAAGPVEVQGAILSMGVQELTLPDFVAASHDTVTLVAVP